MFATHVILSGRKVRPWLLSHIGRPAFYSLHSTVSLVATGAFIWAYIQAGSGSLMYPPLPGARIAALAVMPFVLLLIIGRITTRTGEANAPNPPIGIYRICRHPGSFGLLLWTIVHLMNVAEDRNVVAFVAMAAIAIAALVKNEVVRRSAQTSSVPAYMVETSILPFAAIIRGRQQLYLSEIGWWRPTLALALYATILWLHPYVIGVDPLAPYR
jgi:uncharacterized membrane protein